LVLTGHPLKDPDYTIRFHRGDLLAGTPYEKESETPKPEGRAPVILEPKSSAVIELLRRLS
jgi:hypothetical protein